MTDDSEQIVAEPRVGAPGAPDGLARPDVLVTDLPVHLPAPPPPAIGLGSPPGIAPSDGGPDLARAGGPSTDSTHAPLAPDDPVVRYRLRTVRAGVWASFVILAVLALYVFLPGGSRIDNRGGTAVLIGVAAALTAIAAVLPWRTIVRSRWSAPVLACWVLVMVGLVDVGVVLTGSSTSELYVVLVVCAVFLSGATYPLGLQVALNAASIGGYLVTVAATTPGQLDAATLTFRAGMMASAGLAVGTVSHELGRHFARQSAEQRAAERRVELWRRVARVVRKIDVLDSDGVLEAVVDALEVLDFESVGICVLDPGGHTYRVLAARNLPDAHTAGSHPADRGVVARVLRDRRVVVVDACSPFTPPRAEVAEAGYPTVVAGPVWTDGELAAVLEAGSRTRRPVQPDELAAFELLCAQAGHALENAHLLERRRRDAERYRQLLDAAPDAVVVFDSAEGKILQVSHAAERLFGYTASELMGRSARELVPARIVEMLIAEVDDWLERGGTRTVGIDRSAFGLRRDGVEFPIEITFSSLATPDGPVISAAIRDVTERREFERRLAHQATHDPLTGLPNRVHFRQRLTSTLHQRLSVDPPVALLFLDLDHFKYLNDSRGHSVGDQLVVAVAERLVRAAEGHFVARVGGDEFGFLVEGVTGGGEAEAFARRLATLFERPFPVDGTECYVTASIGVAVGSPGDSADVLLRNTDAAVNQAKQDGRDRIELFDHSLTLAAAARVATGAELHLALQRDELRLVYQPVVSVPDGRPVGVEALLRWDHPERGAVPPLEFVPIAEESGLIVEVGRWVLHRSCAQLAAWRAAGLPVVSMSVNVSNRQLEHDHFVGEVRDALEQTGIPPELLVLEITESVFIRDFRAALRRLEALKGLGVRLAIDDFGTGFSSLFSLSRLPVDVVKIDKAFVDGLGSRYDSVVEAVVTLADAFDLTVVAEGIERQDQCDRLVSLGCWFAQGYLFARPLKPDAAAGLVRARAS